jgi:hypothetical protein
MGNDWPVKGAGKKFSKFSDPLVSSRRNGQSRCQTKWDGRRFRPPPEMNSPSARQVLIVNAIVFLTVPLSIVAFMRDPAYYDAPLFVTGVALVVILSVMTIPAAWLVTRSGCRR